MQWKIGTLKNLLKRSIIICSDQHLLQKELEYLRNIRLPAKTFENIIKNELEKENVTTENSETKLQPFLPFSGKQGIQVLSKMKKQLKKTIPSNVKTFITYGGTKLSK